MTRRSINDNDVRLTAGFRDNPGKPLPEATVLDFVGAKDDAGDGDNWSYKTCKDPVKSSPTTNPSLPLPMGGEWRLRYRDSINPRLLQAPGSVCHRCASPSIPQISVLQARCPSSRPVRNVRALKGKRSPE